MLVSLHSISTLPFTSFAFLVQEHSKAHIYREKKNVQISLVLTQTTTAMVFFGARDGPELL